MSIGICRWNSREASSNRGSRWVTQISGGTSCCVARVSNVSRLRSNPSGCSSFVIAANTWPADFLSAFSSRSLSWARSSCLRSSVQMLSSLWFSRNVSYSSCLALVVSLMYIIHLLASSALSWQCCSSQRRACSACCSSRSRACSASWSSRILACSARWSSRILACSACCSSRIRACSAWILASSACFSSRSLACSSCLSRRASFAFVCQTFFSSGFFSLFLLSLVHQGDEVHEGCQIGGWFFGGHLREVRRLAGIEKRDLGRIL